MRIFTIVVFVFNASMAIAESNYEFYRRAFSKSPTGTLDITVVDEKGIPVEDVFAEAWFGYSRSDNDETDERGNVVLKEKSQSYANYSLKKKGYYTSRGMHNFISGTFDCVKETFWGYEWIPSYKETVVLKTIRNPIPMYACYLSNSNLKLPDFNQAFPFDLQKMDWCEPHGKGIRDDVYIEVKTDINEYNYMYPTEQILTFKHKDEGMYITQNDVSSDFKSSYHANANGIFKSKIIEYPIKGSPSSFGVLDHYRVFRIRCEHDEKGDITSAHYGKIYGYWLQSGGNGIGNVIIYFNPTANDTNLEYDPEQNLYKGDTYEEIRQSRDCAP